MVDDLVLRLRIFVSVIVDLAFSVVFVIAFHFAGVAIKNYQVDGLEEVCLTGVRVILGIMLVVGALSVAWRDLRRMVTLTPATKRSLAQWYVGMYEALSKPRGPKDQAD